MRPRGRRPITVDLKTLAAQETPQLELVGLGAVLAPSDDGLELAKKATK